MQACVPSWLLRLGLFIYDHLGGRKALPKSRKISLASDQVGAPLKSDYKIGFEYSDCWVDDARLVILNAQDAVEKGAKVLPRHEVISVRGESGAWLIETRDRDSKRHRFQARVLVNAAGPWVSNLTDSVIDGAVSRSMRLIRGSHIVVPRLYAHDRCYLLQNSDDRIVFVIPTKRIFSLIGTTDREHQESLNQVTISKDEAQYLCASVNDYFNSSISLEDIVWSYSAVRPLFDDGNADAKSITRDYRITSETDGTGAPLISVLGGKITTYRKLAGRCLVEVNQALGVKNEGWTGSSPLPGGSFDFLRFDNEVEQLKQEYPFLSNSHAHRLMRLYGSLSREILGDAMTYGELGRFFGGNLYENEVRYLMEREWAMSVEDILWRRTKEGLNLSDSEVRTLSDFLKEVITEADSSSDDGEVLAGSSTVQSAT